MEGLALFSPTCSSATMASSSSTSRTSYEEKPMSTHPHQLQGDSSPASESSQSFAYDGEVGSLPFETVIIDLYPFREQTLNK